MSITAFLSPKTYLIIDDHPVIGQALAATLGTEHRYLYARSLEEGLAYLGKHRDIDLIIYDLSLPDCHGMEGLHRLRQAAGSVPVLVYSARANRKEIEQAFKLGVLGFLPKTTATEKILRAVEVVLKGEIYVPEEMVLTRSKITQPPDALRRSQNREEFRKCLTTREADILPWLIEGQPNKEIATLVALAENTVRVHVRHIFRKAGVKNRTQLAAKWFRWLDSK